MAYQKPEMTTNTCNLTDRQIQILQLISEGINTKMIGDRLKISDKTVEYHRAKLMTTLNIFDIPTLVRFAIEHNLVKPKQKPMADKNTPSKVIEPIKNDNDLTAALLKGAAAAAAGTADVLQINALCQCSDALIRVARLQMEAAEAGKKLFKVKQIEDKD